MLSELRRRLRRARESLPGLNNLWEWLRGRKHPIFLEFLVRPRPRWGFSAPVYRPMVDYLGGSTERYRRAFTELLDCRDDFAAIPIARPGDPAAPYWDNTTLPAIDAMALYRFLVKLNPRHYVEIGSGNSTKFARDAIRRHGLRTQIISIDPHPRAEVDALCDVKFRGALEDQDLGLFDRLEPDDVVFLDGSHFTYQNSDTVVFFLEVLPRLPAGVWVHIHDILWPRDYPPEMTDRYFTEQYLLAAYILGGAAHMEMQLANQFALVDLQLGELLEPIFSAPNLRSVPRIGSSFWFSVV